MNLSELPRFGHLRREVRRWGLRGSGNDLADHRLKKHNDSCLPGLWKAAAPRKNNCAIFPQNEESSRDAPMWRRGGFW